jgi:hypothetical protein
MVDIILTVDLLNGSSDLFCSELFSKTNSPLNSNLYKLNSPIAANKQKIL